jgi:hypothetical protein
MAKVTITIIDTEDPNEVCAIECSTDWDQETEIPNSVLIGVSLMKFIDRLRTEEEEKAGGTD